MFGMEKKTAQETPFDMQKDLCDPAKNKALLEKINERVEAIKKQLREGGDQEDFNRIGIILHGYVALRVTIKGILQTAKQ